MFVCTTRVDLRLVYHKRGQDGARSDALEGPLNLEKENSSLGLSKYIYVSTMKKSVPEVPSSDT